MNSFKDELRKLLNRHSMENRSNTPDYILAAFMLKCLNAFDDAIVTRTAWYGYKELQEQSEDMGLYDDKPCPECGMKPAFDGMWHKSGCGAVNASIRVGPFQSRPDGDNSGGQEA